MSATDTASKGADVRPGSQRAGFTVIELMLVVTVVGILATMTFPRVTHIITRSGASQAVGVVATDLEYAVSLASRQRRPVRISCDCANGTYTIRDRGTNAVLFQRNLGGTSGGMSLTGLVFSAPTVDLFPSGLASSALTITVNASGVTRQVTMSSAGFVRVVR